MEYIIPDKKKIVSDTIFADPCIKNPIKLYHWVCLDRITGRFQENVCTADFCFRLSLRENTQGNLNP